MKKRKDFHCLKKSIFVAIALFFGWGKDVARRRKGERKSMGSKRSKKEGWGGGSKRGKDLF